MRVINNVVLFGRIMTRYKMRELDSGKTVVEFTLHVYCKHRPFQIVVKCYSQFLVQLVENKGFIGAEVVVTGSLGKFDWIDAYGQRGEKSYITADDLQF